MFSDTLLIISSFVNNRKQSHWQQRKRNWLYSWMKSLVYLIKKQSQLSLRFSNPLTEAVRSFPHEERNLSFPLTALIGQRSGYQGFPCSWRTIKQTAPKDKRQYDKKCKCLTGIGIQLRPEATLEKRLDKLRQKTHRLKKGRQWDTQCKNDFWNMFFFTWEAVSWTSQRLLGTGEGRPPSPSVLRCVCSNLQCFQTAPG